MRKMIVVAMLAASSTSAYSSDLPFLRGSYIPTQSRTVDWEGVYVGGQGGHSASGANFGGANQNLMRELLSTSLIDAEMGVSSWPTNQSRNSVGSSNYGAFIGYNTQWDDVVVGVEFNYVHGKFGGGSSGSLSRRSGTLSNNFVHDVTASSRSAIEVKDMATFRGRAGYAFGSFLPYMFGGLAIASADVVREVSYVDVERDPGSLAIIRTTRGTRPEVERGRLLYGFSAGLGLDVNLIGGLFARGEYEYARFPNMGDVTVNSVRGGLGYRF